MTASSSGGDSNSNDGQFDWSTSSLSASNFTIGGGRVDGSFQLPSESTTDFAYPSPFAYPSFAPAPSSAWYPSLFGASPSSRDAVPPPPVPPRALPLPPAPPWNSADPDPLPLLDSTEHSLFSTFLTTLDIDPKFLFNPVLPPGMPSPPNPATAPGNEDQWEREQAERDRLGVELDAGLDLDRDEALASLRPSATFERRGNDEVRFGTRQTRRSSARYDSAQEQEQDQAGPNATRDDRDDSDFDPNGNDAAGDDGDDDDAEYGTGARRSVDARGRAGGARRKSRSGGVSGSATDLDRARAGKKSRTSAFDRPDERDDDDDAKMEPSDEAEEDLDARDDDDPDYSERVPPPPPPPPPSHGPGTTTRQKRARPPSTTNSSRRNSTSSTSAATMTSTASTTPTHGGGAGGASSSSLSKGRASSTSAAATTATTYSQQLHHLSHTQKRQNHIESEQRRRNAIKVNFKDLVELVIRGQSLSGVILGPEAPPPGEDDDANVEGGSSLGRGGKKRASATKGNNANRAGGAAVRRGRGRKGDTGANASKSVVLERARDYIRWLERGNLALEREVERVESLLVEGH